MKLSDLLEGITLKEPPRLNPEVEALCFDSRQVGQGSCFVAQVGVHSDGHDYIPAAVERGAVAVVCQHLPGKPDPKVAYVVVENSDIALGNVIGSNIFNVFFVLGTSATVRPLPAYDGIELDAIMAATGSIIVWLAVKTNHERKIQRWAGALLLIVYGGYLAYRLMTI